MTTTSIRSDLYTTTIINKIRRCDNQLDKQHGVVDHSTRQLWAVARRHAYFRYLYDSSHFSYRMIGEIVGRALGQKPYDHSTVLSAVNKAKSRMDVNDSLFMPIYLEAKEILEKP